MVVLLAYGAELSTLTESFLLLLTAEVAAAKFIRRYAIISPERLYAKANDTPVDFQRLGDVAH